MARTRFDSLEEAEQYLHSKKIVLDCYLEIDKKLTGKFKDYPSNIQDRLLEDMENFQKHFHCEFIINRMHYTFKEGKHFIYYVLVEDKSINLFPERITI